MNKCYSKVWNAALGQVVVASELASTKSNGATVGAGRANLLISRAGLAVALGFALAGTLPSVAFAADAVCVDPTNTTTPVPVGNATAAGDQVACGTGAVASAANTVAIGNVNVKASATNAVAVGSQNVTASGAQSVALGYNANATNTGAIAIGAGNGATGLTSTSALGANSIAIGSVAYAIGDNAVAIGRYATTAANSVGIGYEADTAGERTVSVGYNTYAGNEAVNIGYANTGFAGGFRGAFRRGSTLVGYLAESGGAYTTVMGNNSNILTNQNVKVGGFMGSAMFSPQGAFSNVFGAYNKVGTLTDLPTHTSIAVSVVGAANNVNDSNGVFIGGYGNTIKNAYDDKLVINDLLGGSTVDTSAAIASRIQDPNTALGQVGIIGAGNTIDTAKNTFVSGVKNKVSNANLTQVTGFQQVADKIDNVFVAGSTNTVNTTSKSFIAGTGNTVNNASGILAMGSNQKIGTAAGNTAKNSILLGDNINYAQTTSQQDSVAVGNDTEAATGAVAVGVTAKAKGDYSIAIGYDAIATGSVATGLSARAGNGGSAYGDGAVATYLGGATTAGTVAGTAVGKNAIADISGATALGTGAKANVADSIAIGTQSVANIAAGIAGYDLATGAASTNTSPTWVSTRAAVSVGDAAYGITRQITSVAAGAADTDAVNVAQLKQAVAGSAIHYVSIDEGDQGQQSNYNNDGASALFAIAIGSGTTAAGQQSVSLGDHAASAGTGQVSIGSYAGHDATNSDASTFVGALAGSDSSGSGNTALGSNSGIATTGQMNTAVGRIAGTAVEGDYNAAFGANSGTGIKGDYNAALGANAGSNVTGSYNVMTGNAAGGGITGDDNVFSGTSAGLNTTGNKNIGNGYYSSAMLNGDSNVSIGTFAGSNVTFDASGNPSGIDTAYATRNNSVSIGYSSNALLNDAVAIGNGATAKASVGDVAIGSGSVTAAANPTASGTIAGVTYNYAGTNPTSVVSVGDVGAERQITNVAAGRVSATSTDAINGSQLYATNAAIEQGIKFGDGSTNNKYNLGDTINVKGDANITSTTTADGVQLALGNVVTVGTANPVVINGNTGTIGGLTNKTYDPNNIVSGQAATEDQLAQVSSVASAGWTVTDANAKDAKIGPNGKVTFVGDNNVTVAQEGVDQDGKVSVKLNNNLDLTNAGSVTIGNTLLNNNGLTITGGPSVTTAGINAGDMKIINVAPGTLDATSKDAVNGSQLYATNVNVTNAQNTADNALATANKGINFGDGSTNNNFKLGDTINVKGDANITSTTTADGVQLALGNVVTVGTANPVVINGNTGTIGGLTNKTYDPNNIVSGQAATEDQLQQVNNAAIQAKTTVTQGDNIVVTKTTNADGSDNYQVATAKDVAFDTVQVGGVKIDGATNIISGVAPGALNATSTEAVNGSQLFQTNTIVNNLGNTTAAGLGGGSTYDPATGTVSTVLNVGGNTYNNVNDALGAINTSATAGWNLTAQGAGKSNVAPGETVDLNNTDGNIVVTKTDTSDDVTFNLAKNIVVDSVKAGNTTLDTNGMTTTDGTNTATFGPTGMSLSNGTVINNTNVTIAGGTTINMGNNIVGGVAAGVADTDAVNVSQLKAVAAQAGKTSVTAGNNMVVTETTLADGSKNYEVATSKNVAFDTVKVGNVNIDGATGKISGVTAGDISATSTDAVNGSQLYATNQKIDQVSQVANAGWNISAQGGAKGNVKPGGSVDLHNTDGNIVVSKSTANNDINFDLAKNIKVDSVVLGNGTTTLNQNGLIITNGPSVTASGGINAGGMAITNVKAGTAPTDAVNVSQLQAATGNVLQQANSYTDVQINGVRQDLWRVDRGYRGGTASAMAMATLPQAYIPGKSMAAIAASHYEGESGLAVGVSGVTENGRVVYKLNTSGNTTGQWGVAVGAGIQW